MLRVPYKFRNKLDDVATGPFVIRQVYDSWAVTIEKYILTERVSIRQLS